MSNRRWRPASQTHFFREQIATPDYNIPPIEVVAPSSPLAFEGPSRLASPRSIAGSADANHPATPVQHLEPQPMSWGPPLIASYSHPASEDGESPSDVFSSQYDQTRGRLLDILSSLHGIGMKREIDLPQVVIIGSQSVGKSSLIESMCGITLPRDLGTCTRCPTECRLQRAPTWSCDIYLRFHVGRNGLPMPSPRDHRFGETIVDKDKVEGMLRRAQRAILRPDLDISLFLNDEDKNDISMEPLSFSQNIVCLRIAGPNIPELYFYDLPGIIANVRQGGNSKDISLVRRLAEQYIHKPNCFVILVISCETDFENQGAGQMVYSDPDICGRTIGVLTKVDRIEAGGDTKWLNMVHGKDDPLPHGWFAVKQPSPEELSSKITWQQSRTNEENFFIEVSPWSSLTGAIRKQLGSPNLADKLGLPEIRDGITLRLQDISRKLQDLPRVDTTTEPHLHFLTVTLNFASSVSASLEGLPQLTEELGFIQSLHVLFEGFQAAISQTCPRMLPWKQSVFSDDESMLNNLGEEADEIAIECGKTYYLDQIQLRMKRAWTRELPGNVPYIVKKTLICEFLETWEPEVFQLFEKVKILVASFMRDIETEHFGKYSHTGLHAMVSTITRKLQQDLAEECTKALLNIIRLESIPWTLNQHYFFGYKKKMITRFQTARGQINHPALLFSAGVSASDDPDLVIDVMAEVRAYFQVAYKRFTDNVCLQIDATFVRKLQELLRVELLTGLKLSPPSAEETYREWLKEDPAVSETRNELLARQSILKAAAEKLENFHI